MILYFLFEFKRLTTIYQQIVRTGQQDVVGSIDKTVAPRLVGHGTVYLRQENVMLLVILKQLHPIIHKHAPFFIHQQFPGVTVTRLHRYIFKVVILSIPAHAIHRGHPQASLLITQQTLYLIVGQS